MVTTEANWHQSELSKPTYVVASGNQRKINGFARYPGIISSLDPERDCGRPEPTYPQAERVAWDKTETVRRVLDELWPEGHQFIITANDVNTRVSHSREGLNRRGQHRELYKLDRQVGVIKSPENMEAFSKWATLDALEMYCNGQFFVLWDFAAAVRDQSRGVSAVTTVTIIGCFNPLDESEVLNAFNDGTAYSVGPRVQLAELAAKYANEVYIYDGSPQSLDLAQLQSLVIEGVMPWSSFEHLLQAPPPQNPNLPYSRVKVPLT
jgi:hypothetical protein